MAKQAEAERERRAKVINADGEFQAAQRLADAAEIIQNEPGGPPAAVPADHARNAAENNTTTIFPFPLT